VAFASATTMFLNLDTTAVLLTPVMLALAARVELPAAPLAMTTVWLANTASLLLPVSNLRAPAALTWSLLPWRLLVFVTGLFLVVQTVSRHGLDALLRGVIGSDGGPVGVVHAAVTGAVLSNLLNNLPTYVAGEAAVPLAHGQQLLGLRIGTNVGPIVTPWAQVHRPALDRAPLVEAGEQQEVLHQQAHPHRLLLDPAHQPVELGRLARGALPVELGEAPDGGERGPQLVAGVGDEAPHPLL
jgi:hypothetical protein